MNPRIKFSCRMPSGVATLTILAGMAIGLSTGLAQGQTIMGKPGSGSSFGSKDGIGGGGSGGSKGGSGKLGEWTPGPTLPAPDNSIGAKGETELHRKMNRVESVQLQAAAEEQFLKTIRIRLLPGTWKPDQVINEADGSTLLHHSVRKGFAEAVDYLLEKGANPVIKDRNSVTPLDLARELKQPGITTALEKAAAAREAEGPGASGGGGDRK